MLGKCLTVSKIILAVLAVVFCFLQSAAAGNYRIGYLEGGSYWLFSDSMDAVKESLESRGWLDRITFQDDAWFSPGWDKEDLWGKRASELMDRGDLDLVIAAGTDAAEALLEANNNETPVVGMAISDPVRAGLVESTEDSGIDNFTVRQDPGRYKRMFEMFHEVVKFKRLGVIYPDTKSGRQYTNLEEARAIAEEKDFELLEYDRITSESADDCLRGIRSLLERGMDAFFIPSLLGFDWEESDVEKILNYLNDNNIPTFARNGSRDVRAGALMGFSTVDFTRRGKFLADMIIRILEGEKPRSLNMVDKGSPKISFNLYVANKIGFNPPYDLLAATDELYKETVLPEDRKFK
ncbi:MAG: ABC transporter substrate binding protein [Desulfosalsimonas sp.]